MKFPIFKIKPDPKPKYKAGQKARVLLEEWGEFRLCTISGAWEIDPEHGEWKYYIKRGMNEYMVRESKIESCPQLRTL